MLNPGRKAWARKDAVHESQGPWITIRTNLGPGVTEIGERTCNSNVGNRQLVADEIAAFVWNHLFEIIEDRRQIVELSLLDLFLIAREAKEPWGHNPVEKDPAAAGDENCVCKFLEPDGLALEFGIMRDHHGVGIFRLEIVDDGA